MMIYTKKKKKKKVNDTNTLFVTHYHFFIKKRYYFQTMNFQNILIICSGNHASSGNFLKIIFKL